MGEGKRLKTVSYLCEHDFWKKGVKIFIHCFAMNSVLSVEKKIKIEGRERERERERETLFLKKVKM